MENILDTKLTLNVVTVLVPVAVHNNEHSDFITCSHCGKRGPVLAPGSETTIVRDGICLNCLTSQSKAA